MTLDQIANLVAQLESSNAPSLYYRDGDRAELRLRRAPGKNTVSPAHRDLIRAPAAGFFRLAHPLGGKSLLQSGASVRSGEIVGFLQAGPALRPVFGRSGIVRELLIRDGDLLGFGAPICAIEIECSATANDTSTVV